MHVTTLNCLALLNVELSHTSQLLTYLGKQKHNLWELHITSVELYLSAVVGFQIQLARSQCKTGALWRSY